VNQDSIASADPGPSANPGRGQYLVRGAREALARLKTNFCDECSQPIRWWNRRVWLEEGKRCAHRHCWSGQRFLKDYVQLMSAEIRHSTGRQDDSGASAPADSQLSELRAFARTLRERVERLEGQLRQAEELDAIVHSDSASDEPEWPRGDRRMSSNGR
jgi:hypothetical protein